MRALFRMILVVSGLAAAVSSIEAADITISGPLAQPAQATARPATPNDSEIPFWEFLEMEDLSSDDMLVAGPFHYGSGFGIKRGFSRRGIFRYRIEDYFKIRYPRLLTLSQHGRLGGRQKYIPAIKYTRAFSKPNGFRSTVRYGFR